MVTGMELPADLVEFVVGNRLVRVASDKERDAVSRGPSKYLDVLSRAAAVAQADSYGLRTCPVSGNVLDASTGFFLEVVLAGRLVRVCCPDCLANIDETPA